MFVPLPVVSVTTALGTSNSSAAAVSPVSPPSPPVSSRQTPKKPTKKSRGHRPLLAKSVGGTHYDWQTSRISLPRPTQTQSSLMGSGQLDRDSIVDPSPSPPFADDDDDDYHPTKKAKKSARADDDDGDLFQEVRHDSESDSSVVVIGSLHDEMLARAQSHTASTSQKTQQKSSTTTTNSTVRAAPNKRKRPKQLLTSRPPLTESTEHPSLPRRDGTSAADQREPTERSAPWPGVRFMCKEMELNGKFTAVDVGRKNMGICQISCLEGEKMCIKNWMLIDLDELCAKYELDNPNQRFSATSGVGGYGDDDHCHCLFKWIVEQSLSGGIFDSSVVFIEQQSFTREMKALQTTVQLAVMATHQKVMVRRNDPDLPPREANCVSPAVLVSANSVKTCYAAFYPRVTETRSASVAKDPPGRKRKAFGHADANRGDDTSDPRQYAQNKKNSVLYGQKVVSVERIIELLGDKMSAATKARFRSAKRDDIYDAAWLCWYGIETWLPAVYARRKRGYGAACIMYGSLPQRRYRTCDALFEFATDIGTPAADLKELRDVLSAYRRSGGARDDEIEGDL
jgi:hypothetical protein